MQQEGLAERQMGAGVGRRGVDKLCANKEIS